MHSFTSMNPIIKGSSDLVGRDSVAILGFQPHFVLILYVILDGLTVSLSLSLLTFTVEPNMSARILVRMK